MNAKRFLSLLALIALILASGNPAGAQASAQGNTAAALVYRARTFHSLAGLSGSSAADQTSKPETKLSESQKSLMEGSKKAILKTGMSEPFFNRHFRLVDVFDNPSDRRVVWRFSINEYEAIVNDAIGYYPEGGKRVDIHSVENVLSSTADIKRTIPRSRAHRIMRACLGKFAEPAVEYRASGSGKAGLFLVASSIPRPVRLSENQVRERERKRSEEESRNRNIKKDHEPGTDVIDEEKEDDRPQIYIGSINLETGKCTKGVARAGPARVR